MLKNRCARIKKLSGLSLIELMVALTVSSFLLVIMTAVFLGAEHVFKIQEELSNLQENKRIAVKLLTSDLRLAGYIGCAKLTADFPLKKFQSYDLKPQNKIAITANTVEVQHVSISHANLLESTQGSTEIILTNDSRFSAGDILLISDCKTAEIFQIKSVIKKSHYQIIIPTVELTNIYDKQAEVAHLEKNYYFVAKTNRKSSQGKPIYAFYYRDINNRKTELIENINRMNVHLDNKKGIEIMLSFENDKKGRMEYIYVAL